ncbi:Guanylate kinase [Oligella urethralis]|uniref:Guanylate kinase n=1 Tax=Oligella urethralis TaxID=90245 RepID=A0A2X1UMN2_9BURK|nr:guanylate kinase [Oligella urethralis]MDK6202105.1 guanylate kinase [Oligella urethralis]WOS37417.1 Guanylate kinase [Oligella urethralis]SPY08399.1 Guanylate kinase [Oligella urethralis]SUA58791.1 Guanylate kinase [Oligella urethralis]SUA61004.1 Guanylate kinase [Oligella urethralis]
MKNFPGNVFMVVAPSGAGKSSLISALLKEDSNIGLSISCTTRAPRPGEQDNVHYKFLSVEEFETLRDSNELLEWAKVHDNYYGTPKAYVQERIDKGQDILLEIDWQGAAQVREQFPQVIDVFILPPSIEILNERLNKRGQDSQAVIERRVLAASKEIAQADKCEYVIINDDFSVALQQLQQIVAVARLRFASQAKKHSELFQSYGILAQ